MPSPIAYVNWKNNDDNDDENANDAALLQHYGADRLKREWFFNSSKSSAAYMRQ